MCRSLSATLNVSSVTCRFSCYLKQRLALTVDGTGGDADHIDPRMSFHLPSPLFAFISRSWSLLAALLCMPLACVSLAPSCLTALLDTFLPLAFPYTRHGLLYPFDYPYFWPDCLNLPSFPPLTASACCGSLSILSLRPFTTSSGRFLLACMLCFLFHLRMLAFVVRFCFPSLCAHFVPSLPSPYMSPLAVSPACFVLASPSSGRNQWHVNHLAPHPYMDTNSKE